jgi:TldD protein
VIENAPQIAELMRKLTRKSCQHAHLRVEQIESERLSTTSMKVSPVEKSVSTGYSIRVLKDGSWGFAGSSLFDPAEYERVIKLSMAIADASRKVNSHKVEFAPSYSGKATYETPVSKDPFALPLKEKLDLLLHWEDLIHKNVQMNSSSTFLDFRRHTKWFYSNSGGEIKQVLTHTGAGITCGIAKSRRERFERSFPTNSGQFVSGGFEAISAYGIEDKIPQLTSEVEALAAAAECPSKTTTIILSPDLASLQIHESIGHPLELDRVFGSERNFSGTSFATPDKLRKLQYASDIVNVYSDPTQPGGLASYAYDDEGVAASRMPLIKDGMLVGYLSSLETAARVGMPSSAAARADGWGSIPLVRMTNLILEPGNQRFADMLSDVDDGIFIEGVSSWSIDDNRDNFTLSGEIGWEIKGGKLAGMIKSPSYSGNTVQFWNSCDSVGSKDEWTSWGTPNCGKGEPGQNARTAQGSAYLRFRNVKVGA